MIKSLSPPAEGLFIFAFDFFLSAWDLTAGNVETPTSGSGLYATKDEASDA